MSLSINTKISWNQIKIPALYIFISIITGVASEIIEVGTLASYALLAVSALLIAKVFRIFYQNLGVNLDTFEEETVEQQQEGQFKE